MPRQKKEILEKVVDFLELPPDVILDLPRLVMYGDESLVIENHRGLIEYSAQVIKVRTTLGKICISGEDLNLISIEEELIRLKGRIHQVELPKRRG